MAANDDDRVVRYLMLGSNEEANWKSIAQFSEKDADAYPHYENFLNQVSGLRTHGSMRVVTKMGVVVVAMMVMMTMMVVVMLRWW
jgi:hypothetical protein